MLEKQDTDKEELKEVESINNKTEVVEETPESMIKKSAENEVLNFLIKDIGYGSF